MGWMPAGSAEKPLRFVVDRLAVSQLYAPMEMKANYTPGCIGKIIASRPRKVIIFPYSVLLSLHLKQCAALAASVQERDPDKLAQAQKRDSQAVRGLMHTMYKKPMQEMCFSSLEETKYESTCTLPKTEADATRKTDSSQRHTAEEQEAMDMSCSKENSCWIKNFTT